MLAAGLVSRRRRLRSARASRQQDIPHCLQKGAGNLIFLKERGILERKLAPLGWSVTWTEFQAGPQLLKSLNVGATDFGLVGEAPPIFAQAAGANIVYAGFEPASPKNEAIIVPKDSPIRTVTDLKGKRVALNKGSNVNYLIVRGAGSQWVDLWRYCSGLSRTRRRPCGLRTRFGRCLGDLGSVLRRRGTQPRGQGHCRRDGSCAKCILLYGVASGRGEQPGGLEGGAGGDRRNRRLDQGQPQTVRDRAVAEGRTSG